MQNFVQTTAPTSGQQVSVGDFWTNPANGELKVCRATSPAIDWVDVLGSAARLTNGALVVGGIDAMGAGPGSIVLQNNRFIQGVAASGLSGSSVVLIGRDSADRIQIGQTATDILWGPGPVALGGGVAPTLGTIGGVGPTVAAQNGWTRVIMPGGAVRFWPHWA